MKEEKLLRNDPLLEADAILSESFYGRPLAANKATDAGEFAEGTQVNTTPEKPTHYKVICISMYTKDLEQLDAKVAELKRRGWTKANKSQLIRLALQQIDIDALTTPVQ